MDNLKLPSQFTFEGNISKDWKKAFNFFLTATESDKKSVKTSTLPTCIGGKGSEIYNTFTFDTENIKLL